MLNYSSVEHGITVVSSLATLVMPPLSDSFDQVISNDVIITSFELHHHSPAGPGDEPNSCVFQDRHRHIGADGSKGRGRG